MASGKLNPTDKPETLKVLVQQKIRMLEEDFKVVLTGQDIADLRACETVSSLDRVAKRMILKRLGG